MSLMTKQKKLEKPARSDRRRTLSKVQKYPTFRRLLQRERKKLYSKRAAEACRGRKWTAAVTR